MANEPVVTLLEAQRKMENLADAELGELVVDAIVQMALRCDQTPHALATAVLETIPFSEEDWVTVIKPSWVTALGY